MPQVTIETPMRFLVFLLIAVILFAGTAAFAVGGGDITFTLTKVDPVIFSHDYHVKTKGIKCAACHFQKFSKGAGYEMKREAITKRGFCTHCHNGLKSFDVDAAANCFRCHKK